MIKEIQNILASTIKETITLENGIVISKGQKVKLYDNGKIAAILTLDEDTLANGFLFKKGTTLYFSNLGFVMQGTLARNEKKEFRGILFEFVKDDYVQFYQTGTQILSGNNIYEGGLSGVYNFVILNKGRIFFHIKGDIMMCNASNAIQVKTPQSTLFTKPNEFIKFGELQTGPNKNNVSITSLIPIKDTNWNGSIFLAKDKVCEFRQNNKHLEPDTLITFTTPYQIFEQSYLIENNHPIRLYDNGKLSEFSIAENVEINNLALLPKTILRLRNNGKDIHSFFSSNEVNVEGVIVSPHVNVYFDDLGNRIPSLK
jgi:hypothetical protein